MIAAVLVVLLAGSARAEFEASFAAQEQPVSEAFKKRWAGRREFDPAKIPPGVEAEIAKNAAEYEAKDKATLEAWEKSGVARVDERHARNGLVCQERLEASLADRQLALKAAARTFEPVRAEVERYLDGFMARLGSRTDDWRRIVGDQSLIAELARRYPRSSGLRRAEEEMQDAAYNLLLPAATTDYAATSAELTKRAVTSGLRLHANHHQGLLTYSVELDGSQPRLVVCSGPFEPLFSYTDGEYGTRYNPHGRVCVSAGLKDGAKGGTDALSALANRDSDRLYTESADEWAVRHNWDCVFLAAVRRALAKKP